MIKHIEMLYELQTLETKFRGIQVEEVKTKIIIEKLRQMVKEKTEELIGVEKKYDAKVVQIRGTIRNKTDRVEEVRSRINQIQEQLRVERRVPVINLFKKTLDKLEKEMRELFQEIDENEVHLASLRGPEGLALKKAAENVLRFTSQTEEQCDMLQHQLMLLEEEKEKCLNQRTRVTESIPDQILQEYERLRMGRNTGILARATDRGSCEACGMALRLETQIKLRKKQELVTCDGCGRILFQRLLNNEDRRKK